MIWLFTQKRSTHGWFFQCPGKRKKLPQIPRIVKKIKKRSFGDHPFKGLAQYKFVQGSLNADPKQNEVVIDMNS